MKIDRVKIKNFKILKDIDITLSDLTLITGINSSGKSSFIQSLLLLKQNQQNLRDTSIRNNNVKTLKEKNELSELEKDMLKLYDNQNTTISLNGDYLKLGDKKNILNSNIYKEDIFIELGLKNNKNEVDYYKIHFNNENLIININNNFTFEYILNIFHDDFQYITTDRISPTITYPLSEFHINKNLIGLNGEYTAHYLAENRHKVLDIKALQHPNAKTEQLLENVSLWLGEISNGIDISTKVYPELQQANLTYSYVYGDNKTDEYTPLNVGFGVTYVLPIIVAILKSKPNDLLIIENPESHLHPAGQVKIAELCAIASSCGVQIIVESHSDHFLNGVRVATKKDILKPENSQIYYFEKDDKTISTKIHKMNIDKDGKIDNWVNGFFDEYANQLDELLW